MPGRRMVVVVPIALLALLGVGWVLLAPDPAVERAVERPTKTVPAELPPYVVQPAVRLKAKPKPKPAPVVASVPSRLQVPSLGIDVPVVGIGAVDGILIPPSNPQTVGWYRYGAQPGARTGGALITGHTVHTGGGAFDDLETVHEGDAVTVRTAKGRIRYEVTGVEIYRKAALAAAADEVFNQSGPGRLVLITCEDWNGTDYESNAIVYADPV